MAVNAFLQLLVDVLTSRRYPWLISILGATTTSTAALRPSVLDNNSPWAMLSIFPFPSLSGSHLPIFDQGSSS